MTLLARLDSLFNDDDDNRFLFYCPVCNRTYYARLGSTYRLSLVRPRMTGTTQILPWNCWFNFTALGGHHGDRVLVRKFEIKKLKLDCEGGEIII